MNESCDSQQKLISICCTQSRVFIFFYYFISADCESTNCRKEKAKCWHFSYIHFLEYSSFKCALSQSSLTLCQALNWETLSRSLPLLLPVFICICICFFLLQCSALLLTIHCLAIFFSMHRIWFLYSSKKSRRVVYKHR